MGLATMANKWPPRLRLLMAAPPAAGYNPNGYQATPSAYGQQPNPGNNPYAQPPAQPGATPGYGQGAAYDPNNPSSALQHGSLCQHAAPAAAPARNVAPYTPGSTKPLAGTSSTIVQAGFDAKQGDNTATAAVGYGNAPAGVTCENGICYPNGSTTTATPAGYQAPSASQGAYGNTNAAPATTQPTFYR